MRPKRVCHIVQAFYPNDSRILREARALVERGFDVDVICLRGAGEKQYEVVDGVHVRRFSLSRRRGSQLRYLFEYVAFFCLASAMMVLRVAKRYDVIHVSNMPDFLVFSALLPKLCGSRVVLDEHDPMPELFMSKHGRPESDRLIRFIKWQERVSQRFSDHVLTVTDPMRARIERTAGSTPVSVVMNVPDGDLFRPSRPRPPERNGREFVMLYAGTLTSTYNLAPVIEALHELSTKIPGLRLRIVGDGDQLESLSELARGCGVSEIVEFVGRMPFCRVPEFIESSDIGISTVKRDAMTELCFMTKAAEYVIMGLPTIVARTEAGEQYFPEGVVRMYVPDDIDSFRDAVVELYENPEMRADMSRRGVEFSNTSNWSTEKSKYTDLIDSLCRSGNADA